jgi:hypothetical protein
VRGTKIKTVKNNTQEKEEWMSDIKLWPKGGGRITRWLRVLL